MNSMSSPGSSAAFDEGGMGAESDTISESGDISGWLKQQHVPIAISVGIIVAVEWCLRKGERSMDDHKGGQRIRRISTAKVCLEGER